MKTAEKSTSRAALVAILFLALMAAAPRTMAQPRSILPPVLGGEQQPVPAPQGAQPGMRPVPEPGFNLPQTELPPLPPRPNQNAGQNLGTGQGILGTLPVEGPGPLEGPGSVEGPGPFEGLGPMEGPGSIEGLAPIQGGTGGAEGGVIDGVYTALFDQITGPMPTAGVQSTLRDLLADTRFRQTRGADGLARAKAFYRLGYIEDATGAVVEIDGQGVERLAATASMFLALGRPGQACGVADISDLPKGAAPAPTFALLEVLAFCKLEAGDKKAARLIAGLLRDQGGGDALYRALMAAAISGKPPKINTRRVKVLRPIHAALFARIGQPIPDALVARADLALLAGIARKAADPGLKLAATERLVAAGLAAFVELDDLYAQIAPPDLSPATALKTKAAGTAIGRASIYRLLDEIGDDQTRMALAIAAYEGARKRGAGAAAGVLFSDIVGAIVPRPELARFAASAALLLFDADRPDIAAGWIAAGEYADDRKARLGPAKAHKLKAIAAILAPEAGFGLGSVALGSGIASVRLSKADRAYVASEARLLAALGDAVPPVLAKIGGRSASQPIEAPSIGPVEAIEALAPLGRASVGKIKPKPLTRAIVALRGLGLEGEARRLAADHLMARF